MSVLPDSLPAGWRVAVKVNKDAYTASFTQVGSNSSEPDELPLLVFSEFNGRWRIETTNVPIEWIDPVGVSIEWPSPLVAGKKIVVNVTVDREGNGGAWGMAAGARGGNLDR